MLLQPFASGYTKSTNARRVDIISDRVAFTVNATRNHQNRKSPSIINSVYDALFHLRQLQWPEPFIWKQKWKWTRYGCSLFSLQMVCQQIYPENTLEFLNNFYTNFRITLRTYDPVWDVIELKYILNTNRQRSRGKEANTFWWYDYQNKIRGSKKTYVWHRIK